MSACSFSFANRSDCTMHGTDGCTCVQPSVFEKEKKRMEVVRNSNEENNIAERDNGDYTIQVTPPRMTGRMPFVNSSFSFILLPTPTSAMVIVRQLVCNFEHGCNGCISYMDAGKINDRIDDGKGEKSENKVPEMPWQLPWHCLFYRQIRRISPAGQCSRS